MADKLINKRKKNLWIVLSSIALVLAILIGVCAIYLGDYYRADMDAIEAFATTDAVQMQTLDNGNVLFAPEDATQGFIFYPGGKVEHKAYIPLMQALAEKGVLCVIVEMPFHLAVLDVNAADGIQEQYPQIEEWYIGGHSLGGSMAASYLTDHTGEYNGLILLGAYSTADLSDSGLAVLSVYGSEDKVMNREKYANNKSNLPNDFTEVVIDGGCHAYFGMYGSQDGDGTPTITNEEQINCAADKIMEMIQRSEDTGKDITEEEANNDGTTNSSETEGSISKASFMKQSYKSETSVMNYWLYTPENPTDNMPLIVYLHGGSGKGDDLELITAVDGFPQYLRDGKISPSAYVIVPQVSSAYRGWGENKTDVMKLVSFVTEEYKIDENRISLTGHSMGGTGAWMLALAYPDIFSAVAPLSGSVKLTDANINKLKNMPVWAIVGSEDTIVDPQSSIDFIAELAKVNENAKLTELDGVDHFEVSNLSYLSNEFDLIEWLLAQVK